MYLIIIDVHVFSISLAKLQIVLTYNKTYILGKREYDNRSTLIDSFLVKVYMFLLNSDPMYDLKLKLSDRQLSPKRKNARNYLWFFSTVKREH